MYIYICIYIYIYIYICIWKEIAKVEIEEACSVRGDYYFIFPSKCLSLCNILIYSANHTFTHRIRKESAS